MIFVNLVRKTKVKNIHLTKFIDTHYLPDTHLEAKDVTVKKTGKYSSNQGAYISLEENNINSKKIKKNINKYKL